MHISSSYTLTRRRLFAHSGLAAIVLAGISGCQPPPPPPEVITLRTQRDRASYDSALAYKAAEHTPELKETLTYIGQQRHEHAQALDAAVSHIMGKADPAAPPPTPDLLPTLVDVKNTLIQSAHQAESLAITHSGYPAGLLACISAACVVDYQLVLAQQ